MKLGSIYYGCALRVIAAVSISGGQLSGSTVVTSNLPFEDWTSVLGLERLTGALLDRLTHHVSILSLNGDSDRLKSSRSRRGRASGAEQNQATTDPHDPETGEIVPA